MPANDKTIALRKKLAIGYIHQAEMAITLEKLRHIHKMAEQVLIDGNEFTWVNQVIINRAKFLGYTGDLGDLYA